MGRFVSLATSTAQLTAIAPANVPVVNKIRIENAAFGWPVSAEGPTLVFTLRNDSAEALMRVSLQGYLRDQAGKLLASQPVTYAVMGGLAPGASAQVVLPTRPDSPWAKADWRGRTVLLNLWATWCVPCRKEMPALDALEAKLGGPAFQVVAINIDTRDLDKPKSWLKDTGIDRLTYYADPSAKVFQELKVVGRATGMPTTLLVDPAGCEIATLAGPAEWASNDAVKLVTAALKS